MLRFSALSAQETAAASESPHRLCCIRRGSALLGVIDSGAGILRVARNPVRLLSFLSQSTAQCVISVGLEQSSGSLHRPQDAGASQATYAGA